MKNYIQCYGKLILFTLLSFITYLFSNGELSLPVFVWIYPVFFLYLLYLYPSLKTCLILFAIYSVGFVLQFLNIIGMGIWPCIAVSVLVAAVKLLPYIFWMNSKRSFISTLTFAAVMTVVEYSIYCIYPILGGLSDAYTQYQNLPLLQLTTVTGVYGILFLIYWTAAVLIWLWDKRNELGRVKRYICVYSTVMSLVFLYGAVMLHVTAQPEKSARIAAVTVPVSQLLSEDEDVYAVFYTDTFTDKNLSGAKAKLSEVVDELFVKTIQEADAGAKIVFWSELNGAVMKEDETALLEKASHTAKEHNIYLLVSLLVKTPYADFKENKTVAFNPSGELISEYLKYGRSMGELCIKGDGRLKSFDTEYGRVAPFICSDMAFASVIRQAGENNVDILIVPASDWKEMTELALKTAVVRGVENGCNVVRHTNQGISAAADYRGNILSLADYFQSDTKTLAAQVLTSGRFTVYSYIGNAFVYLCGLYLSGMMVHYAIKRKKHKA